MVVATKNSLFIHFPKNAGRWISSSLINNVKGSYYIGSEIYDAHQLIEINDKKTFLCVRDPVTWLHSLWHHRARKKGLFGLRTFNWQKEFMIEKIGSKSKDFNSFINKVIELDNPMIDYYKHFIPNVEEINFIYFENLANSLIEFLRSADEEFDESEILRQENVGVNSTNRSKNKNTISNTFKLDEKKLEKLIKNNKKFFELTRYSYNKNHLNFPSGFETIKLNKYFFEDKLTIQKNQNYIDFLSPLTFSYNKNNYVQNEIIALMPKYIKNIKNLLLTILLKANLNLLEKILSIYIILKYKPEKINIKINSKSYGKCLEFGGGNNPIKRNQGFLNVDSRPLNCVDIVSPVNKIKDKFSYKSISAIFNRNFLEHLTLTELSSYLNDCHFLLADNGFLEAIVPSNEFNILQLLCSQPGSNISIYAFNGLKGFHKEKNYEDFNIHKSTFTYSFLRFFFMKNGFNIKFKKTKLNYIHFFATPNR